ncbi:MAG: ABC transporter permease [Gaiellaceae bacterium]
MATTAQTEADEAALVPAEELGAGDLSPRAGQPTGPPEIVIRATHGWAAPRLREIWQYRELLYFLIWRDVKVRYKQTAIGIVWTIAQPIAIVALFTIIFGHLAKLPTNGTPYPLFFYSGYLPWQVFALALTQSSTSLVSNQQLVTKVYFPRILIPTAVVLAGLVDFGISCTVLLGFYAYYGITPTLAILALPVFVLLVAATALAVGVWLSAVNVRYRDVQYTLPFLTQLWFFATPIAYAVTLLPARWRLLYGVNPMAGVVEGFRWCLFRNPSSLEPMVGISVIVVILLGITGVLYFRRVERTFADVI